jgi:hypothetical protein
VFGRTCQQSASNYATQCSALPSVVSMLFTC